VEPDPPELDDDLTAGALRDVAARVPRPVVKIAVNITPGKPPPGVVPPDKARQLASLQKAFLDHLAANPAARAKFLSDPGTVLRRFSPAGRRLADSLDVDVPTGPVLPAGPNARLESLTVNVRRRAPTPRSPRASEDDR
jgi:hypothetical protein